MKILNNEGINDERILNKKRNNQRIKFEKINNELSINNCTKNKKIIYKKKNIDEAKGVEIKILESVKDNASIGDDEKIEIEKYYDSIYPKFLTANSIKENSYLKIDNNQKQKGRNIIIENNTQFSIYFSIIIIKKKTIYILSQCLLYSLFNFTQIAILLYLYMNFIRYNYFCVKEINAIYKHIIYIINIIKSPQNNHKIIIIEDKMKIEINLLFTTYSSNIIIIYSLGKAEINNITNIKQRYIIFNKIYNIHISKSNNFLINNIKIFIIKLYIVKKTFLFVKSSIYQKLIIKFTVVFTKDVILNLIINIIFQFIKQKIITDKKKFINFNNEKKIEIYSRKKIGFFEIKKELHKTFILNKQNKLQENENKIEEILGKNENIIKEYTPNYYFNIIIIIIIKFIIIINVFYNAKSNIFDYCFWRNSKIKLTVKGFGENKIINLYDFNNVEKIYINSNEQKEKKKYISF